MKRTTGYFIRGGGLIPRPFRAGLLIFILLFSFIFTDCNQSKKQSSEKPGIVCTIFPQYDWVRQILADRADNFSLTLLLNNRIDLHNYQPTVDDIIKISNCDLFIYVGGESDKWVNDVLTQSANPNMIVINLLEILEKNASGGTGIKTEEYTEGMQIEEDHDSIHDIDHEAEYDEHVWLSLNNAMIFCSVIADALSSLDAENTGIYQSNLSSYTGRLTALDLEYHSSLKSQFFNTLLFADRFPFRYLVDDYGIGYYAAFTGCSAETEASFDTIIFLAKKTDELNLNTVMVTESSDQSIARTVINSAVKKDQKILVLDSMQSVTLRDAENGTTYISIMEKNLSVLKEALN